MVKKITIAIDAMGGDNSPEKIINGIKLHFKSSKNVFYNIFGDADKIKKLLLRKKSNADNRIQMLKKIKE